VAGKCLRGLDELGWLGTLADTVEILERKLAVGFPFHTFCHTLWVAIWEAEMDHFVNWRRKYYPSLVELGSRSGGKKSLDVTEVVMDLLVYTYTTCSIVCFGWRIEAAPKTEYLACCCKVSES
jgi:hypothetical protein